MLDYPHKPSVLDMCSGKGGDLNKWVRIKPSHYVALEYQKSLVEKAMERLSNFKNVYFPSIFIVNDAGDPHTLIDHVFNTHEAFKDIRQRIVFDVVSCQFSMHYLYGNETMLNAFLHNISCRLEPGGFYFGTTIDAEKVVALVRSEGGEELCI